MADKQIDQLPNASSLTGSENVPLQQSGVTVKSTTAAIAALGSAATMVDVSSGLSVTVVSLTAPETQVVWRSASIGNKTTNIPGAAAGNNGYDIDIKVTLGNGDNHTITPASGTIEGASSLSFTDTKENISLRSDGANTDWIIR